MVLPVFFVVFLYGHVAETVGPLPFAMPVCVAHVAEERARMDRLFADPARRAEIPPMPDGRRISRAAVDFACSHTRPPLS